MERLDPRQRTSPPSRELIAQGVGNVVCGLVGGLPVTSVIVRSSVNVNAGSRTKLSAVLHGVLLLVCVALVPGLLNLIPLSCLAAILLVTGFKLASPSLVRLSCIDSRTPAELIFDLGVGDIFSVRVAGNVTSRKIIGSVEFGCAVAGAKLVLVMGHTRCGAVTAAVELARSPGSVSEATGCQHLEAIVRFIQESAGPGEVSAPAPIRSDEKEAAINAVARRNVLRVVEEIRKESQTLDRLVAERQVAIVGAMYDVTTGAIEILTDVPSDPVPVGPTA